MISTDLPIDEFVAHRPPMRLLDRIITINENEVVAETIVRADNPFFEAGRGIPAYVGLEMMAQAIAAIDGMKRRNGGLPAKIGFLLGCRRYATHCASFAENMRLTISAKMVFSGDAMFAFDCRIDGDEGEVATAGMKVYAPDDPQAFLEGVPL
jgi:predicted hotdog family 3-hydroxylacyl-ACP dehydratase